jgi:microcystin-dependent protein
MGIEVATYISGLTSSWPPSSDFKSQGDDHLRLIKSVLQSTFPTASGPMYFPKTEVTTITLTLDVTDQNNSILVDTTAADVVVNLPSGFTTTNAGWSCEVWKTSADTNGVMVTPATGTISSQVGPTSTVRVGAFAQPARFIWSGSAWFCVKPGPLIGSTVNFDGAGIPRGYLTLDGSTFNGTTFAELAAILGTTTLKDKRGRSDIGSGTGSGLTARTLGTTYGAETKTLVAGDVPTITSRNASQSISVLTNNNMLYNNAAQAFNTPGTGVQWYGFNPAALPAFGQVTSVGTNDITVTSNNTGPAAFGLLHPTIASQKLIRAC